jgi:hypothetical protein
MANLYERIKQTVLKMQPSLFYERTKEGIARPVPQEEAPAAIEREIGGYLDKAEIIHMIRTAGRQGVLLHMRYNNVWRHVEPYSFRSGKQGILVYGHCLIHNDTHSFYLHKIQGLQLTETPFAPRWTIEL